MPAFHGIELAVLHGRLRELAIVAALCSVVPACGHEATPPSPVAPSCSFSVSSSTTGFESAGGTGTAAVTTSSGCTWKASSQASWISVDGADHTGSGTVPFTVAESKETSARSAALTVAQQTVSISQAAAQPVPQACQYGLGIQPRDFERDGGGGILTVSAAADCPWTLKMDAGWLSTESTQGTGPATIRVSATPNEDAAARRMTLTVADATAVISQPGQGDCLFQIAPVDGFIPRIRWSGGVDVQTSPGCRWTATADMSWIHLNQSSGRGSARLAYEADSYPSSTDATRTAVIALRWMAPTAGQNVRLTQSGDCHTLVASTRTVGAEGGRFSEQVLVDPVWSCAWAVETADAWVSVDHPRPGQVARGDGDVVFTIPANTSTQPRQAVLVVGEKRLTITQQGRQ